MELTQQYQTWNNQKSTKTIIKNQTLKQNVTDLRLSETLPTYNEVEKKMNSNPVKGIDCKCTILIKKRNWKSGKDFEAQTETLEFQNKKLIIKREWKVKDKRKGYL